MKLSIPAKQLDKPLLLVRNIVNAKHINAQLQYIKLQAKAGIMHFTGSDGEIEVQSLVGNVDTEESLSVLISPKQLYDIVSSVAKDAVLHMEFTDNKVIVTADNDAYKLSCLDASSFPQMKLHDDVAAEDIVGFSIAATEISTMTQKVVHAVAHQDIRQYLNGMLFEFIQDTLRLVTTDSHRMGIITTRLSSKVSEEIKRFIVAKRSVAELTRILSLYEEDEVDIKISQHTLIASMDGWRFSSKLMNVNYPNYEQVIPAISNNYFSCNSVELKQALRKTSIVGEQNSTIQLALQNDKLVCESRNLDNGETACTKIAVESNVDAIDLSFNSKYLSDIIATANEKDKLVFHVSQEQQGVLICIDENKDVKYVIMPIKI